MASTDGIPLDMPLEDTLRFVRRRAVDPPRRTEGPPAIEAAGRTDIGCVRDTNEDHFLIADLRRALAIEQTSLPVSDPERIRGAWQGKLLAVADGLGGHAAGEVASSAALDALGEYVLEEMAWHRAPAERDGLLRAFERVVARCNDRLAAVERSQGLVGQGMGTTLTTALVRWPDLHVVHAGDSRCYLLRGGRLRQLTSDHTVGQRMVDRRRLDPAELDRSPLRNVLLNALGGRGEPTFAETHRAELEEGDLLLLCSDGLTHEVADPAIADLLRGDGTAAARCDRLIEAAKQSGGRDNITVVVAQLG